MANQIITNYCSTHCDFCFAVDSRRRMLRENHFQMDETEVRAWLDFTLRGGIRELRLLGGEPTMHPCFDKFVNLGREAGCTVTVFSNGVMSKPARSALAALDPEVCNVVINMSASCGNRELRIRQETLEMLGPRVSLGYTLTSAAFSFREAVTWIENYRLRRNIRIGLAHPTWQGANRALHPKCYPMIGQALLEQSFLTAEHGISLDADCGFVRCMFGNSFDRLTANGFRYISRCSPVLDLCTGGRIIPCFGLSNLFSLNQADFPDAEAAFQAMTERIRPLRTFGIYPECSKCVYFETEECCGGCIAARLRRLQPMGDR
ncbi:MAG: radical SAM protein [Flexilinea sp.]|nr:radical SAM protein [Flexilinea sp.]